MNRMLESISNDLMIPEVDLLYLIRSSPYRYKVYEIAKRNSDKKRVIAQPAREVKSLQYWVMKKVLRTYAIHPAAMAYRKGKNIANNAMVHAKRRFLLKLDFKDFFNSITADDFRQFLHSQKDNKFSTKEMDYLCRILFWNRDRKGKLILSIGAPSSPMLSNVLMYEFDEIISLYCKARRIRYTRYADDLTFSTNVPEVLRSVEYEVAHVCDSLPFLNLKLNNDKTIHASKGGSRRVTGLVLSNDGAVSIGRDRKRVLQSAVHHFVNGKLSQDQITSLSGMLAFLQSFDVKFLETLGRRYGDSVLSSLLRRRGSA